MVTTTSEPILTADQSSATTSPPTPAPCPPAIAGRTTSTTTVNKSSTTSQPTAMCPVGVCRSLLSTSTRVSTTVLATETDSPKTAPAAQPQPNAQAVTAPRAVATRLWTTAPG